MQRIRPSGASLLALLLLVTPALAGDRTPAQLAKDLVSEDRDVRSSARKAINALGPPAVPALLEAMAKAKDPDAYLSKLFDWRFGPYTGPGLAQFRAMLEKRPVDYRVVLILDRMGSDGASSHLALARVLSDPKAGANARTYAALAFLRGGYSVAGVMAGLSSVQGDSILAVVNLAEALLMASKEAPLAAELLTKLANALRIAIARDTITALVPVLRAAPADFGMTLKLWRPLARLGSEAKPAVGVLRHWLTKPAALDPALRVLSHMGQGAASARPELEWLLANARDPWRLTAAALCMLRLQPDHARARAVLDEQAPRVADGELDELARVLGAAGADVPHVASHVGRLLTNGQASVRKQAAMALANVGPHAGAHVPALIRLLDDPDPRVRVWSALAIARVRTVGAMGAKEATDLAKHLDNAHGALRAWVAVVLSRGRHKKALGPRTQAVLRHAERIRPAWLPPMQTSFTWEPALDAELRAAASKVLRASK